MIHLRLCLLAATLISASPGWASHWTAVGEGGNGLFSIAVDLDSVQRSGDHVKVMEKFTYNRPARHTGGRYIHVIKSNQSYDCDGRTSLVLLGFAYGDREAMKPIDKILYHDIPSNYLPVADGSAEEKIMALVCSDRVATK